MEYKVNEIFSSIEGEGVRVGLPSIFIRLQGCNLSCSYCDTDYACEGEDYVSMAARDILTDLEQREINRVTLTGGEPLDHENVGELIAALTNSGYSVNIETNGSRAIDHYVDNDKVVITMDYKLNSSEMSDAMFTPNLTQLRPTDVLKFVAGNEYDLLQMKYVLATYVIKAQVFVSPVYGKIEPKEIVKFILDNKLNGVRVQVQLHKIIWDPEKRGV